MSQTRTKMFANYNRWANRRLYDAAATLPDEDYRADRGAFFKSVHGTLNHLLLADRIWMGRFIGDPIPAQRLDAVLFDDFQTLRRERERADGRIVDFVAGLDDARLAAPLRYERVSSRTVYTQPLWAALDHFFNHQTHHRGQIHAILTGLGAPAPELDLIYFQREAGFAGVEAPA
jgi:uncharacterized damage-inducible protein DinB